MARVEILLEAVDQASGVIDGAAGALAGLGDVAGKIAAVGLAAVAAGATAVAGGLAFSIVQAMEGEKILARLESVIQSTGGTAGLTSAAAQDLATRFMDLAGGSDDAVLAIQEMALRMGTVTAEQMPDFIQTTLDLAAATGTDAVNAARLLAQAQEDPISALTRFRRMGIQFTEDQEKQIKVLMEAGDVAGAQALIMERLGAATSGAAAAAAGTLAGQWEILKGRMGEAAETIGAAFLPILHELFDNVLAPAIPVIETLAGVIGEFFTALATGEDPIGDVANLVWSFANALGFSSEQSKAAFEMVIGLRGHFDDLIASLQPVVDATLNLASAFAESMPMIQTFVADMVTFVLGQIQTLSPTLIANVTTMLNELATFWRAHGDEIMAVVNFAFRTIVATIGGTLTLLSGLIAGTMQIINGDWSGAWESIVGTLETFMNLALAIVGTNLDAFIASWTGTFELARIITVTLWGQLRDAIAAKLMEITGGLQDFIIRTINAFRAVDWAGIGRNIIEGIRVGILSAAGGLISAATGAVQSALDAAKALLGIHSPSTVFAGLGANMMQGMAQGITGAVGGPVGAVRSATAAVTSAVTNHHNGANTYNYYGVQADMDYGYQRAKAGAF